MWIAPQHLQGPRSGNDGPGNEFELCEPPSKPAAPLNLIEQSIRNMTVDVAFYYAEH